MPLLARFFLCFALLTTPAFAQTPSPEANAALASRNNGTPVSAENWMISAANPLAAQAGADVLRKGGTAADAMVAVQAVLGLVEDDVRVDLLDWKFGCQVRVVAAVDGGIFGHLRDKREGKS